MQGHTMRRRKQARLERLKGKRKKMQENECVKIRMQVSSLRLQGKAYYQLTARGWLMDI